jgi:DNA-binding NarL/FixJ family response regulator
VSVEVLTSLAAIPGAAVTLSALVGMTVAVMLTAFVAHRRQKAAVGRLEERVNHLTAGVSLLTNTTEEGLRGIALEIARLAGTPEQKSRPQSSTARQRIASAAGHGQSVQEIAASEQLSEGEVLLHLLMDKLRPEVANAEVC